MTSMKMLPLIAVTTLGFALIGCDAEVEEPGRMPDVDMQADPGAMPEVDVQGPDVDVGTEKKEVTVPNIEVEQEKTEITVPDVDVTPPKE